MITSDNFGTRPAPVDTLDHKDVPAVPVRPAALPTLTVTPKASVPAVKRAVFAFDGAGREFHLYPASAVSGGFAVSVPRLGGYGFGLATSAARSRFAASHPPTAVIDRLAQALGVGKASATTPRAAGGPRPFPSSPIDALILASAANIESLLAGGTVASLDAALVNYTTWQAIAGSQVSGTPEVAVLGERIRTAISAAAHTDAALARVNCFATKDLNSLAGLLTLHAYALARGDIDFDLPAVDSAIDACMRFTVSYEAEINESLGAEVTGDIVVDSTDQPVTLTPGGEYGSSYLLEGSLPLTVTRYDFFDYLCDKHGGTATPQTSGSITIKLVPLLPYDEYVLGRPNAIFFPPPMMRATLTPGSVTTTNACGLQGFSGGLYEHNLPLVFSDIYNTGLSEFVLPAITFTATGGQAQTLFDGSQPAPDTTAYTGRIHLTVMHAPTS